MGRNGLQFWYHYSWVPNCRIHNIRNVIQAKNDACYDGTYEQRNRTPHAKIQLLRIYESFHSLHFFFFGLFIVLMGQPDGVMANVISLLPNSSCVKSSVIKASYLIIGSSFVYLLLLLKSFIFNIYAIVMNSLRWEYHQE